MVTSKIQDWIINDNALLFIKKNLTKVLLHLDIPKEDSLSMITYLQKALEQHICIYEYEKEMNNIISNNKIDNRIKECLINRNNLIYSQIKPYIEGNTILDF